MATNITDLPVEVLSRIITIVAKSPEGARDVARSMPACQRFLKASNCIVVQRAVCFDNVQISTQTQLFQRTNGLLNDCAKAGNPLAEHLLAQVILATCTQLVGIHMAKARLNHFRDYITKCKHGHGKAHEDSVAASFIAHYTPVPGSNPTTGQESDPNTCPHPSSFHWEFVKAFILKSTPSEIEYMFGHLHSYIELFSGCNYNSDDISAFLCLVYKLFIVGITNENKSLLHYDTDYNLSRRGGFIPFPDREVISMMRVGASFEEIRAKTFYAFEVIIPKLR